MDLYEFLRDEDHLQTPPEPNRNSFLMQLSMLNSEYIDHVETKILAF